MQYLRTVPEEEVDDSSLHGAAKVRSSCLLILLGRSSLMPVLLRLSFAGESVA